MSEKKSTTHTQLLGKIADNHSEAIVMTHSKTHSIPISQIPLCVHGAGSDHSVRSWLEELDSNRDGFLSEEEFELAKKESTKREDMRPFASFGSFQDFLERYVNSQLCTPACTKEIPPSLEYAEQEPIRICPPVPDLLAPAKPRTKQKPPVAKEKPQEETKEEPRQYYAEGLPWKKEEPESTPPLLTLEQLSPRLKAPEFPSKQNADGTYLEYADGGVTMRNPELGPHPLVEGVPVDNGITVSSRGELFRDGKPVDENGRSKIAKYVSPWNDPFLPLVTGNCYFYPFMSGFDEEARKLVEIFQE